MIFTESESTMSSSNLNSCYKREYFFFYSSVFLPELERCNDDYLALASCFVTHAPQLEMYVTYCTYQAKSDSVFREYCGFFAVSQCNKNGSAFTIFRYVLLFIL